MLLVVLSRCSCTCRRYLAQHSAFADLVDYTEFTVVVDPKELETGNIIDILKARHGRTSRLNMTQRLHQVENASCWIHSQEASDCALQHHIHL